MSAASGTARWFNAVSVEARGTNLVELAVLPFVRRIDIGEILCLAGASPEPLPPPIPRISTQALHALDYGESLNQVELLNVPALHDMGYSGRGVLICMLDNGFNTLDHEALDHLDIVARWDFVNNDPVGGRGRPRWEATTGQPRSARSPTHTPES